MANGDTTPSGLYGFVTHALRAYGLPTVFALLVLGLLYAVLSWSNANARETTAAAREAHAKFYDVLRSVDTSIQANTVATQASAKAIEQLVTEQRASNQKLQDLERVHHGR